MLQKYMKFDNLDKKLKKPGFWENLKRNLELWTKITNKLGKFWNLNNFSDTIINNEFYRTTNNSIPDNLWPVLSFIYNKKLEIDRKSKS